MARPKSTAAKDETINIRVSGSQRTVIDQAAEIRGRSRSEFMLDASYREAEKVMLERTLFVLDPDVFDEFEAMLDAPREPSEALRAMLTRKAPWE